MPDNSTPAIGPLTVWTLPAIGATGALLTADAASFPWSWAWAKEPLLMASGNRFTKKPGAMGGGTFTILRDTRQEPSGAQFQTFSSGLVAGQYVCITGDAASAAAAQLDPAKVLWWGWISALSYSEFQGSLDGVGTATALEVGHLLDQQQLYTWLRILGSKTEPISSPPTANMGDESNIIGNASGLVQIGPRGERGYAFARLPQDCGTTPGKLWTRWRLIQHVLYACKPPGLPPITIACADGSQDQEDPVSSHGIAGFLNDPSAPEVFDLRNLTIKGALDICAPQARGFGWTLELSDTVGWQVVIYSHAALGGVGGLPVNGSNGTVQYLSDADMTADALTTDVQVVSDSGSMPDEVVIEGSPIVWGATVAFSDGNLAEGWSRGAGNQEDIYRIGASAASDYSTLSPSQQIQRNSMVRSSPGVRDVYSRYALSAPSGDVTIASVPGVGGAGGSICPELLWDGAGLTIDPGGNSRCPYLPAAELLRTIPWPEGVKGDGTDMRLTNSAALPQFAKPRLLRFDSTDTFTPWIDLESRNGQNGFPSMSLDLDDRGAAFRVTLSAPEYLALNHWKDAAGGNTSPAISDISDAGQDISSSSNAIDYTKLVATIALESDQKVSVAVRRPGVTSVGQIRRRLVIREPQLQCWVMRSGSILGVGPDGQPERVTGGGSLFAVTTGGHVLIRNDFPAAQVRANMAASWAFRKRSAVRIQRARPDLPATFARIGFMIGGVIEKTVDASGPAITLTVNTVVDDVSFDFGGKPRIEVTTTMPQMAGAASASSAPSGGGAVSVALGGTISQAVQSQQQESQDLGRDTVRVPVVSPRFAPVSKPGASVRVHQVSHGLSFGQAVGSVGLTSWSAVTADIAATYKPFGNGSVVGLVVSVNGPDYFVVGLSGIFDDPSGLFSSGTLGVPFFLTNTAGLLSQAVPAVPRPYMLAVCTAIAKNQILIYGGSAIGEVRSIRELTDTVINYTAIGSNQITDGDILRYVAADKAWENRQNTISNLVDVLISSPANADLLTYDTASGKWKNAPASGGTHTATSVVGRAAGTSGASADIAATIDNTVLIRTAGTLSWGTIPNAALANSSLNVNTGTGLTGGGAISLGGAITINNSGVLGVTGTAPISSGGGQNPVISITSHGIGAAQLNQAAAYGVLCNPTSTNPNDVITASATADYQVLSRNGSALGWGAAPLVYGTSVKNSSSTTFTVPAGVYNIFVVLVGSGGGSAGPGAAAASPNVFQGSPGGGGGAALMGFVKVAPGQVLTITVGAAGAAGAVGGAGGNGGSTALVGSSPTVSLVALGGSGSTNGPIPGAGGLTNSSYSTGTWGHAGYAGSLSIGIGSVAVTATALSYIAWNGGRGGQPGGTFDSSWGVGGDGISSVSTAGNAGATGGIAIFY